MTVVNMSSYLRRGGLRRNLFWVERAFPDRHWVIADVVACEDGPRRVVVEPVEDRTLEAMYSETYFRRPFFDRHQWLRLENEKDLRRARKKDTAELLHEMARINARRTAATSFPATRGPAAGYTKAAAPSRTSGR